MKIQDQKIENYSYYDAVAHINERENFLIGLNQKTYIGIIQYQNLVSEIDFQNFIFIHSLYLLPQYQNVGLGAVILSKLQNKYKCRIECEAWYNIPASKLYEKAGFQKMYTHFFI